MAALPFNDTRIEELVLRFNAVMASLTLAAMLRTTNWP